MWDNYILKKELIVKHAWEIGKNDPDGVGIQEDDDPIIPVDQANPPVSELLQLKRESAAAVEKSEPIPRKSAASSVPESSAKERAERRKADRKREKRATKKKKRR